MKYGPYTCVYREIWDTPKFWELSKDASIVLFYSWTTTMGNGFGCFKAGIAAMVEECRKLTHEEFKSGLLQCIEQNFLEYDEHARVMWIPAYFKRNAPRNGQGLLGMKKDFVKVPTCELKLKAYITIHDWVSKKGSDTNFLETFNKHFDKPLIKSLTSSLTESQTNAPIKASSNTLMEALSFHQPEHQPSHSQGKDPLALADSELLKNNKRESAPAREAKTVPKQSKNTSPYTAPFLSFWETWSRIVNNKAKWEGFERWEKMRKKGELPDVDELIANVVRIDLERAAKRSAGEFVEEWKNLPSWLYKRRWEDRYEVKMTRTNAPRHRKTDGTMDFLNKIIAEEEAKKSEQRPVQVAGKAEVLR